jgi:hypothetical protein
MLAAIATQQGGARRHARRDRDAVGPVRVDMLAAIATQ